MMLYMFKGYLHVHVHVPRNGCLPGKLRHCLTQRLFYYHNKKTLNPLELCSVLGMNLTPYFISGLISGSQGILSPPLGLHDPQMEIGFPTCASMLRLWDSI